MTHREPCCNPIIDGYGSNMNSKGSPPQTFPAILYDGIGGELLSNTGDLAGFNALVGPDAQADGVNYDPYGAGDQICANSNINANPAPPAYDEVNTGLVYPPDDPADVTQVMVRVTRCRIC